jgi:hypothetical protein
MVFVLISETVEFGRIAGSVAQTSDDGRLVGGNSASEFGSLRVAVDIEV